MDFHERVRLITAQLNEFLRLYKRPEHLDNEAALTEMRAMAEELNSLVPSTSNQADLTDRVARTLRSVRQTYKGRAWPTVSHIIDAANSVAKQTTKAVRDVSDAVTSDRRSPNEIAALRMNAGEAVGDSYIYGRAAVELINSGAVSRDTMRKYRSALYFSMKDTLGEEMAKLAEASLIDRHDAAEALA